MRHRLSVAVLFGLIAASCSSSSAKPIETVLPAVSTAAPTTAGAVPTTGAVTVSSPTSVATTATGSPAQTTPPTDTTPAPIAEAIADPLPCDPLDPSACLLPWPNDAFTRADASTPTGHRLAIAAQSPPKNSAGTAIDVTDQDRADGFSPGSAILVHVAGLDPGASSIAPSTDIGASLADAAPILLIDATSGERWPYWAELDATATSADTQLLMVHPAKSLTEAHRYIVVLQHLRTATAAIATSPAFTAALAGTGSEAPRAAHLQHVVDDAVAAGADRSSIYMAWDFTVASAKSLAGRLLSMRDQAYTSVAGQSPAYTVQSAVDAGPVRTIRGTFAVPNFLTNDGSAGNSFQLGSDGLPQRNASTPDYTAPFLCLVPTAPTAPTPVVVYGHGLLGSREEAKALTAIVATGRLSVCASDWIGMASDDIANLATILGDASHFNEQADRLQQGLLNMQFLGRAINATDGFAANAAFEDAGQKPVIAPGKTVLLGNSQGGILGGAASAVSTEWTDVALGVPGIDYSLLLPRSSDWAQFEAVFDKAYTGEIDRQLTLQLMQLLWDRGENDGYAQHLTANPYPGIDAKKVLLIGAFGDHQVSNVATNILARTIDATLHAPALAGGRSTDVEPFWGIHTSSANIIDGSAYVMWDYGNPPPPRVNLPPTEPAYGQDPHGKGSSEPAVISLAVGFLTTGAVDIPCSGPCIGRR